MALISNHKSSGIAKTLYIGDSSSGKTGSLASLAAEGYNLRIIDTDNGADILKGYATDPESPYLKKNSNIASHIRVETINEEMQIINGTIRPAKGNGWSKLTSLLGNWVDSDDGTKLGGVHSWGPQDILVIDSLSTTAKLAMYYHLALNGALGKTRTQNEWRRDIGQAQDKIISLLETLYDASVKCNVVLISHIKFVDEVGRRDSGPDSTHGVIKGYPNAIGSSISPQIPRYFNSVLIANVEGTGPTIKRKIRTGECMINGNIVAAKTSMPLRVAKEYGLEWGLAEYFKALKAKPEAKPEAEGKPQ